MDPIRRGGGTHGCPGRGDHPPEGSSHTGTPVILVCAQFVGVQPGWRTNALADGSYRPAAGTGSRMGVWLPGGQHPLEKNNHRAGCAWTGFDTGLLDQPGCRGGSPAGKSTALPRKGTDPANRHKFLLVCHPCPCRLHLVDQPGVFRLEWQEHPQAGRPGAHRHPGVFNRPNCIYCQLYQLRQCQGIPGVRARDR